MDQPDLDMALLERYFIDWKEMNALEINQAYLTYRMINTKRPLQEKMTLFWHGILCTGNSKCEHGRQIQEQLNMFRRLGMGSLRDLLLELSRDPAMVFYLDNCMSHKGAINENFGRELLELFSMGVGMDGQANYSEDDVKECARAFTGWTITNAIPRYPYGRYPSQFAFNSADHDDGEKTFMGETGASAVRRSSTSSPGSRPPPGSLPGTFTTTSWRTNLRCQPGRRLLPETPKRSR